MRLCRRLAFVIPLTMFLQINLASAGFVDSLGKSADRAGKSVERKTGQRSDNKNYKNYRLEESKIRVQLPIHFDVSGRNKDGFKASSKKEGISLVVARKNYEKQDAGGPSQAGAVKEAKEAKNRGDLFSYSEKSIDGVRGVETMAFAKKGDRESARTYKWEGWDPKTSKHIMVTANFPAKKYDANKYDFEGIINSLRWNFEETHNK